MLVTDAHSCVSFSGGLLGKFQLQVQRVPVYSFLFLRFVMFSGFAIVQI